MYLSNLSNSTHPNISNTLTKGGYTPSSHSPSKPPKNTHSQPHSSKTQYPATLAPRIFQGASLDQFCSANQNLCLKKI